MLRTCQRGSRTWTRRWRGWCSTSLVGRSPHRRRRSGTGHGQGSRRSRDQSSRTGSRRGTVHTSGLTNPCSRLWSTRSDCTWSRRGTRRRPRSVRRHKTSMSCGHPRSRSQRPRRRPRKSSHRRRRRGSTRLVMATQCTHRGSQQRRLPGQARPGTGNQRRMQTQRPAHTRSVPGSQRWRTARRCRSFRRRSCHVERRWGAVNSRGSTHPDRHMLECGHPGRRSHRGRVHMSAYRRHCTRLVGTLCS